ncbi:MAG: hypothetical protein AB1384_08400 [Actinomycetota bacterium]
MNDDLCCHICGIPLMLSKEFSWDANGAITLKRSSRTRMVLFESDSIDHLFRGIEELIGLPVANIVIESKSRDTKRYIERLLTPEMSGFLPEQWRGGTGEMNGMNRQEREASLAVVKAVTQSIVDLSRVYGYGDQRLGDAWESGGDYPWRTQVYRNPYSLLFVAADNLGAGEVFEKTEMWVRWESIGENTYNIEVYPEQHPIDLGERLKKRHYWLKPGGIDYERCPGCGLPQEVATLDYDLAKGVYTDPDTGWRMAIFGPSAIDAIFDDLEAELGEAIPETVIEAQRRYIRGAWSEERWNRSGATFQKMIGLRGLGSQVEFAGHRDHLFMKIENCCLHLPLIGTIQALVEMAYKVDRSIIEWEMAEDGDLSLNVTIN